MHRKSCCRIVDTRRRSTCGQSDASSPSCWAANQFSRAKSTFGVVDAGLTSSYVDQLNLILGVLGTPDEETLKRMSSDKARAYVKTLPFSERVALEDVFPDVEHDGESSPVRCEIAANATAVDLLGKLLAFDPDERIDVTTALQHPYVGTYHDPADEPSCATPFDKWEEVEGLQTVEELREAITREISEYRAEVRGLAELGDGFDDEYEYDEDEIEAEDEEDYEEEDEIVAEPEEVLNTVPEAEAVVVPQTRFSELQRSGLGLARPRSPSMSPRMRRVTLPGQRRATKRDESPATPGTTVSEESFGHAPHAATVGRHSRRSSNHSTHSVSHRRSMNFLFGGASGMTSLSMTSASGGPAASNADGTAVSSAEYTAGSVVGRRSRAPSSTVDLGSLRPLIRQLSATNISDMRINTDDEPLHTDKSPRPTCMTSRRSSRGSRGSTRRPSSVCLAAETVGWRAEAEAHSRAEEEATEQPPPTEETVTQDDDAPQ